MSSPSSASTYATATDANGTTGVKAVGVSVELPGKEKRAEPEEVSYKKPSLGSGWSKLPVLARRLIVLVVLIGIWDLYIRARNVNPLLFPSPESVADSLWADLSSGALYQPTLTTLKLLGMGMLIGGAVATVLVVFATWAKVGEDLLSLLTAMLNPLPAIAVLPLAMIWFGLNDRALLFVVANAVTWPIAINVAMGFKTVNPAIVAVGRNIGLSKLRLVLEVLSPAALPHAITGLKTSWAFGWRTLIAAELVFGASGSSGGLGNYIANARYNLQTAVMVSGLVVIAVIGIAFDGVFTLLERRTVVRWGMKNNA